MKAHLLQQYQQQCLPAETGTGLEVQGQGDRDRDREREDKGGLRKEEVVALRQAWTAYEANATHRSGSGGRSSSSSSSSSSCDPARQRGGGEDREQQRHEEEEEEEGGAHTRRMPVSALSQVSCYGDSASQKLLAVKLIRTDITHVEVR